MAPTSYTEMDKLIEQYYRLSGELPNNFITAALVRDSRYLKEQVAVLKKKVREGGQLPMPPKLPPVQDLSPGEEERFKEICKIFDLSFRLGGSQFRVSEDTIKRVFVEMPEYVERKTQGAFRDQQFAEAWRKQEILERRSRLHVVKRAEED